MQDSDGNHLVPLPPVSLEIFQGLVIVQFLLNIGRDDRGTRSVGGTSKGKLQPVQTTFLHSHL